MTPIVGVDPGQRSTGIVTRDGAELLAHLVVEAEDSWELGRYIAVVTEAVHTQWWLVEDRALRAGPPRIAVEDVTRPNVWHQGKRQLLDPTAAIETAKVMGAIVGRWPRAVVVAPAGNGKSPLAAYPPELVGPRETTRSGGRRRHARSAWDIAGAGAKLLEQIKRAAAREEESA